MNTTTADINEFLTGVYYDMGTSECYTYDYDDDTDEIVVSSPWAGTEIERLGVEEFRDILDDQYPVPEEAVSDPVGYFNDHISRALEYRDFDAGFEFADMSTKVIAPTEE